MEPIQQQSQSSTTKPMVFPKPPKSALFGRLEAFLPVLANENKKVEQAIACGEGDRYNIEIPEPDAAASGKAAESDDSSDDEDSDEDMEANDNDNANKAPVIEMNFALGLMEDGGGASDDADSDSSDEEGALDLAKTIAAASHNSRSTDDPIKLNTSKPQTKKPLIQELN